MTFYQTLSVIGKKYVGMSRMFKWGFNLSPMYSRTTAKISYASKDLHHIKIKLPLSYKNKNYVGTIFGGSMSSATDPIFMVQLTHLLGNKYVVWDKAATIRFKRPGNVTLYADFDFSEEEITEIKNRVSTENEIEIVKQTFLTNEDKSTIFCEVDKTIYIADKAFYKKKLELKRKNQ